MTKFLDLTGLGVFWTRIKDWVKGYFIDSSTQKIKSSLLPSYVDDVLEFSEWVELNVNVTAGSAASGATVTYCQGLGKFVWKSGSTYYANGDGIEQYGVEVEGQGATPYSGKIYVNTANGKCYRWSGSGMVEISKSPTLYNLKLTGGSGTLNATYDPDLEAKTIDITPEGIGAATAGHTHKYAGSSSPGGAATSAVKLQTARGLKIGSTSKNFDGSSGVTWTLEEIGAAPSGHNHVVDDITDLALLNGKQLGAGNTHLAAGGIVDYKGSVSTQVTVNNSSAGSGASVYLYTYGSKNILIAKKSDGSYYNNWENAELYGEKNGDSEGWEPSRNVIYRNGYDLYRWTGTAMQKIDLSTVTNSATAYCATAASTGAKTATALNFKLETGAVVPVSFAVANTAQSGVTLNINGTGAKTVLINGSAVSSTNYNIPIGTWPCYYNGTNWIVRTDGVWEFKNVKAGTFTGNLSGNASTATKLATAKTINGTSFDGSGNITTAKWGTGRKISITGSVTGSVSGVDGSGDITIATTTNHTHSTLTMKTVNSKGADDDKMEYNGGGARTFTVYAMTEDEINAACPD